MEFNYLIFLFVAHFVGDYLLQSDEIAKKKSKCFKSLFIHISFIFISFFVINLIYLKIFGGYNSYLDFIKIPLLNSVIHLVIDFFTSKWASKLYSKNVHYYYVILGFDQLLHYLTVLLLIKFI